MKQEILPCLCLVASVLEGFCVDVIGSPLSESVGSSSVVLVVASKEGAERPQFFVS